MSRARWRLFVVAAAIAGGAWLLRAQSIQEQGAGEGAIAARPTHEERAQVDAKSAPSFQRQALGRALADPFTAQPPPIVQPKPAKPSPTPPPPPPPPPTAPPFPYRVFGKLTDADGKRVTYLMRDNRLVAVENGTELDNGFAVETVSDTSVVVVYAPLNERLTLRLPEAPR